MKKSKACWRVVYRTKSGGYRYGPVIGDYDKAVKQCVKSPTAKRIDIFPNGKEAKAGTKSTGGIPCL